MVCLVLLKLLARVLNALPKTGWKPIPLCDIYGRYGLEAPNLVGHTSAPTVTTGTAGSITTSTATISSNNITSTGGATVTAEGIYWATHSTVTSADNVVNTSPSGTTGTYNTNLTGLPSGTTIFFNAFATNSAGTSTGTESNFTTSSNTPPNAPILTAPATDSYDYSNVDSAATFGSTIKQGQSFTGDGTAISKVVLYLKYNSANSQNMWVTIYAHSGTYGSTGVPTGTALATSDNVSGSVLTSSYQPIEFNFSTPYTTTNGTHYFLTIEAASLSVFQVGYDNTSPTHSGNAAQFTTGTWSAQSYDLAFAVFGVPTVSTTTPELDFSATDPDSDAITYEVQVDTVNTFDSSGGFSLKYIDVRLEKNNSPTDNLTIDVRSTSISGTSLGTSNAVAGTSIGGSPGALVRFTFATPISLSAGTKYYFVLARSGAVDATNYYILHYSNTSTYSGGGLYINNNGSWGSESTTDDANFIIYDTNTTAIISQDTISGNGRPFGGSATQVQLGQSFTVSSAPLIDATSGTTAGFTDTTNPSGHFSPFTSGDSIKFLAPFGSVIDQYPETNYSASLTDFAGSTSGNAQSFTGDGSSIGAAAFYISKSGSPTGNVTVNLYAHSGTYGTSSVPTGSALATATLDITTLTTSLQWIVFKFPTPYTTTNGTHYVISIEYNGGSFGTNLNIGSDQTSPTHSGNLSQFSGSWTAISSTDLIFAVYSTTGGLASGNTYYWRVRGKDPSGSNTFGSWSSTRSFTTGSGSGSINATGRASTAALGSPTLSPGAVNISPTGNASTAALGSAAVGIVAFITPTGKASTATLGSPTLSPGAVNISPTGKASTAALGTPTLSPGAVNISATGKASTTALGSVALSSIYTLSPTAIASTAALGSPTLTPGAVNIGVTGISSTATLGTPTVGSTYTLTVTGINSTATLGSPTVEAAVNDVAPTGIASGATLGSPTLVPGAVNISPTGKASTLALGSPTLSSSYTASITGITSSLTYGSPTLTPGAVSLSPTGVASAATLGSPTLSATYTVTVTGISSTSTLGSPTLTPGAVNISVTAIASGLTYGVPILVPGAVTITPTGVVSTLTFGTPIVLLTQSIFATGIDSISVVGTPVLTPGVVSITVSGIASTVAFGTIHIGIVIFVPLTAIVESTNLSVVDKTHAETATMTSTSSVTDSSHDMIGTVTSGGITETLSKGSVTATVNTNSTNATVKK